MDRWMQPALSPSLRVVAIDQQPGLLPYGRYDPVCGEQRAYLARHAPRGRVVVFEHSAHLLRLEEPERYTREVVRFILE